jgi:hypothetical protein
MTHTGYAKPQMFDILEALVTTARRPLLGNHQLSSCKLQPALRSSETPHSVWVPDFSMGSAPLSASIIETCKQDSRLTAPRPQVFATSRQVIMTLHDDLRVYSTPLALPGSHLQSFPEKRSSSVFRLIDSFTVTYLPRFPFHRNLRSQQHYHRGFPFRRFSFDEPLTFLQKPASVLGLGRS